jgi:acid phosphatase type 7
MKRYFSIIVISILSYFAASAQIVSQPSSVFITKPYLQVGRNPTAQSMQLLWHVADIDTPWTVEYRMSGEKAWMKAAAPTYKVINVEGIEPHRVYQVAFAGLKPGRTFTYKVLKAKKQVFTAEAHASKEANQAYRFVAFGDCGAGTIEQKPVAQRAFLSNPDLVVIPGDMVYEYGLISEYNTKFWPIYNADTANEAGAPLMRSVPFVSTPGNHDTGMRDLDKHPDGLAYFYYWNQPINGPKAMEGDASAPMIKGSEANRQAFFNGAGDAFPSMSNYSFEYGNTHWLMLDSNPEIDWTDEKLQEWVAKDLALASGATWRFVAFHHPGFNSSREHYEQQHMRLLSPILEAGKVDVVFNGHVHNYQRSYPLTFLPDKKGTLLMGGKDGKTVRGRVVNGRWILDKTFDGKKDTTPEGIIYIVTGAGGQKLYNPEQNDDSDSWQKFTDKFISNVHSITVADVEGQRLTIRQLAADGTEIDAITISK